MKLSSLLAGLLLSLPTAARAADEIVCVRTSKANIREGASRFHHVAWVARRFTPFVVVERDGEWIRIADLDGSDGWIHSSLTDRRACVMVAGQKANVRAGPGLDEKILWELELGYPLRVIRGRGAWLEVTDEDEVRGWIYKELVWGRTEDDRGEA